MGGTVGSAFSVFIGGTLLQYFVVHGCNMARWPTRKPP